MSQFKFQVNYIVTKKTLMQSFAIIPRRYGNYLCNYFFFLNFHDKLQLWSNFIIKFWVCVFVLDVRHKC